LGVARHLRRARIGVEVWLAAPTSAVGGDAAGMLERWRGATVTVETPGQVDALARRIARAGVVVDALLGTGLNTPVDGVLGAVIDAINAAGRPGLANDLTSGLSAVSGQPPRSEEDASEQPEC